MTYLVDFGEDYYKSFAINFRVEKQIDSNIKMPYYWSRQLIFIFKEAMVNVAKHAFAKNVLLSFKKEGELLTVTLLDDGKGMVDRTYNLQQNGINNMQYRAKTIGGRLKIHTDYNGTQVSFKGTLIQSNQIM